MAKYNYSAKDKNGNRTQGIIEASDRQAAVALITRDGSTPLIVAEDKDFGLKIKNIFTSLVSRISLKDKMMFCEELSTLINSGVPLTQSISIIKDQSKGTMRQITENLIKEIEGGQSLAGALEKESKYFSPVFINMVRAGEASGNLDNTLNDLAIQVQKDYELVAQIRGALTYPVVIIVAMVGAMIFMMIKVVPALSGFFDEMGAKLPLPTRILIFTSHVIVSYGVWIAILIVAVIVGINALFKKVDFLRKGLHKVILKTPIIGGISLKFNIARFSRTLGSLLGSGVSVLEALDIVSRSTKNTVFTQEIRDVAEKVKNGASLSEPLRQGKTFPVMISQMVSVGEETGTLDKMLLKISEHYERQIDNMTKNISSIIEPIIMLVVGTGIGFIIISIIMPIYKMTETLGQ